MESRPNEQMAIGVILMFVVSKIDYKKYKLGIIAENLGIMFEHAADIGINPIIFWNTFINWHIF